MNTAASALWASIVRTIVPVIVGHVIGWTVTLGLPADPQLEPLLGNALTALFTAIYYAAVRLLETYVTPKFGWLLGLAKTPVAYTESSPADASVTQAVAEVRAAYSNNTQ